MEKEQEIIKLLKEYNQEHIIKLLEKLDGKEKEELINQINNIDFHQINELYQNTKKDIEIKENKIESIQYLDKEKLTKTQKEKFDELGEKEITSGRYAVVTMAGGQGTRLGHTGPKGTFKLDVYGKGKYLFEILAENLKDANKKYNTIIPWYIMTSKENNDQTQEFLEKNNYFGYDRNNVMLFEQGELPLVDTEGKMLISKDLKIKEASDGNGGVFSSLRTSGMLADMKERGIKWVFFGGVDNAILKMADVTLLGMAIDKNVQIASKSVVKANPHERVGVFCKMNGHPKVIEYSELPEKMAEEVDNNGELRFGESHIMCNLFTIDAIEKISKEPLIYHSAFKKNAYIDENGKPKYYGRFNQGVVTINLVDVACSSKRDMNKFWQIFDERLELCYRALMCRHERLKGTPSDVAPILWQHGALARLKKGETIDKLLYGGYSTISLGYAGLYECVKYMTGKSHTDPSATPFAIEVMQHLNDACTKWKEKENIDFSLYGTPIESTTYKFAKCLQKRFGKIEGVTDKNYITNSYHIHVTEHINAFDKLTFESQFQKLSPGGAISYVEVPDMQDNILFIESYKTSPNECQRRFAHLKQYGIFDKIKGIVVGYNYDLQKDENTYPQMEDILLEYSKKYNFPIVKCNDFGHKIVNSVIPIGGFCKIDCENEEVEIIEKFLK